MSARVARCIRACACAAPAQVLSEATRPERLDRRRRLRFRAVVGYRLTLVTLGPSVPLRAMGAAVLVQPGRTGLLNESDLPLGRHGMDSLRPAWTVVLKRMPLGCHRLLPYQEAGSTAARLVAAPSLAQSDQPCRTLLPCFIRRSPPSQHPFP